MKESYHGTFNQEVILILTVFINGVKEVGKGSRIGVELREAINRLSRRAVNLKSSRIFGFAIKLINQIIL